MEKRVVDKEIHARSMRIVGEIELLEKSAKAISTMPCDKQTHELMEIARYTLHKAHLSAWNYADSAGASHE